jgi:hypothetical protein
MEPQGARLGAKVRAAQTVQTFHDPLRRPPSLRCEPMAPSKVYER